MKKYSILFLSFLLFVFLSISLSFQVKWSSPLGEFNVTPNITYLNWTNDYTSNITITTNESFNNITYIEILNGTFAVLENYFQGNTHAGCKPGVGGYYLFVINASGNYNNIIGPLNATNSSIATLIDTNHTHDHLKCKPGRYWVEELTLRDNITGNETANITVFVDIPISSKNDANVNFLKTGIESFSGGLPINATTYHSYYFNITELSDDITNVTGVSINLTGWTASKDVDLFLFDNNPNLKAKSISKTGTNEWLLYNFLPSSSAMWEIRVYGLSTSQLSYNGQLAFSGLNLINNSDGNRLSEIDLGIRNTSEKNIINVKLRNEINILTRKINIIISH